MQYITISNEAFFVLGILNSNEYSAKIGVKRGSGLPNAHSQESTTILAQHLQSKNSDTSMHIPQVKLFVHFGAMTQMSNFKFLP